MVVLVMEVVLVMVVVLGGAGSTNPTKQTLQGDRRGRKTVLRLQN